MGGSETSNVAPCTASNPSFALICCERLRTSSPALATSTSDPASSLTISARRALPEMPPRARAASAAPQRGHQIRTTAKEQGEDAHRDRRDDHDAERRRGE